MATNVTLGGIMSGLNMDTILQKLLDADAAAVKAQEAKKKLLTDKQAAWGEVRTSLTTLRSKLDAVRLVSTFRARTAVSSNAAAAAVTVSAGAALQAHSLSISTLALAHSAAGRASFVTADEALGAGSAGTFTVGVGASTKTIAVTAADTLNSLRDKIRLQAGDLVSTDVVKVQDPVTHADRYRLVVTSKTLGAAGAITLAPDGSSPDVLEQAGLGFTTSGALANVITPAQNAEFTLDGQPYMLSTNVVSDITPGLSITLLSANAVTPVSTTITVGQNQDAVADSVQAWIDALNAALGGLQAKTRYDASTRTAAVLANDSLARQLMSNMKSMLSNVVSGQPANLQTLTDAGITTGSYGSVNYGTVLLDRTKLKAAIATNEDNVATLFGALRTNVGLTSHNPAATSTATSYDLSDPNSYGPANAFNDIVAADRWGTPGGGWKSANTPTPGAPQYLSLNLGGTRAVDNITLFLPDNASATGLKNFEIQYSTNTTDGVSDGTWVKIDSVADNVSAYKGFEFQPIQATWIRLKVTDTNGVDSPATVLEMQVNAATGAPGLSMYRYLNSSLAVGNGTLATGDSALSRKIKDLDTRMGHMLDRMTQHETRLRKQFSAMEQALARFKSQSSALSGMTTGTVS